MKARFKQSLFLKQFTVYMLVLLLSFALLGVAFTNAFRTYYMREKERALIQQAERISEQYAISIYTGIADAYRINQELRFLSDNMGASTMLVSRSGRVIFVSSDIDANWIGTYVNEQSLMKAIGGETVVTESRNINDQEDALTIVYPLNADETVFAALIMSVSLPNVREQLISVYLTIFAVLSFCGLISFIVLYYSVKRITKPLIEINEAAKVIAGGDFEKRIETGLTDEVGQLAESFNGMAESLDELERSKRRFITDISHDIRSPLTSIQGFVTAILDGTADAANYNRYLNIVSSESRRTIKLTNEMIELYSIDDGQYKMNMTDFCINSLIRLCADKFAHDVQAKELGLELIFFEEDCLVHADKEKMERVLENLLDNAIKFTDSGGITIETERIGDKVNISVKDTGEGFTDDEARHVFDRFYKSDTSRGRRGNGLGLSIVRELLKAHGESIKVNSVRGEGSAFTFSLPLNFTKSAL